MNNRSGRDCYTGFGHDLNDLRHVAQLFLVGFQGFEDFFDSAGLADHHVTTKIATGRWSVNCSRFDLVTAARADHGGFPVHIQVKGSFKHQVGLVPGVAVWRLADATGCRNSTTLY